MMSTEIEKAFAVGGLRAFVALLKPKHQKGDCRIRAHNDVEAIERWLEEYFDKPTTYRAYKKEAERFLVWCLVKENIGLGDVDRTHVQLYIEFMRNPEPAELWCGVKTHKNRIGWRPFRGPLSEGAILTAITIINSLMNYLVDARYLDANPFNLVRRKSRFKAKLNERRLTLYERILTDDEWSMIIGTLNALPENRAKARLIFLVSVLFLLGLRIDELAHARFSNFRNIDGKWWFFVMGKGDKLGKIPVNRSLMHALMMYRSKLGMSPLPTHEDLPLVGALANQNEALTTRQMSNLLKELVKKTVEKHDLSGPKAVKLLKLSPHWLRHFSASRQDRLGFSITHIRENLRHENEATTRQYIHAADHERHREMEKLILDKEV